MGTKETNLFADRMTPSEIARFSPVVGRIIPKIMRHWAVSDEDGASLLSVSGDQLSEMKGGHWQGLLTQAQLERASLLINIFSDLRRLHSSNEAADQWVSRALRDPPFEGRRPLDLMLAGSEGILSVRCWLLAALTEGAESYRR